IWPERISRANRATGTEWNPVLTAPRPHPTGRYHAGRPTLLFHHFIGKTWISSATASISARRGAGGSRGETSTARYSLPARPRSSSRTPSVAPPVGSFRTYITRTVIVALPGSRPLVGLSGPMPGGA